MGFDKTFDKEERKKKEMKYTKQLRVGLQRRCTNNCDSFSLLLVFRSWFNQADGVSAVSAVFVEGPY